MLVSSQHFVGSFHPLLMRRGLQVLQVNSNVTYLGSQQCSAKISDGVTLSQYQLPDIASSQVVHAVLSAFAVSTVGCLTASYSVVYFMTWTLGLDIILLKLGLLLRCISKSKMTMKNVA
jgi:hypothetical protein